MILIKTATYESIKYGDNVSIRVTLDGGNTYAVAEICEGRDVTGDEGDLKIIASEIGNLGDIEEYDWVKGEAEMWIRYQSSIDLHIAEMEWPGYILSCRWDHNRLYRGACPH